MSRLNPVSRRIARALRFVRSSERRLVSHALVPDLAPTLAVMSPDFENGGELPFTTTAAGAGIPPLISVANVPAEARSLALVCETPDAPTLQPFIHWLVFRLPGNDLTIDADAVTAALEGRNSRLDIGWAPIDPARGHGLYRYHFEVFALDSGLPGDAEDEEFTDFSAYYHQHGVEAGAGRAELIESMRGRVLAWGEIVGTYER